MPPQRSPPPGTPRSDSTPARPPLRLPPATGYGCGSAADAVADADVVLVSVPRPEHVRDLAAGALHAASPGSVVVDLSTIDPATARQAAERPAPHKVTYLDCPVLGRPAGCGSWTLVAGGDADAVTRVAPMLEQTVAKRVARVGDVGAGSVVKILNNLMFGAINAVTAEALDLASRAGIGMDTFVDAVLDSCAATVSNLFRDIGPRMAAGDDDPVFALDLLAKDSQRALHQPASAAPQRRSPPASPGSTPPRSTSATAAGTPPRCCAPTSTTGPHEPRPSPDHGALRAARRTGPHVVLPAASRDMVLVEVEADGVVGIGQSWVNYPAWAATERVATLARGVVPLLAGLDVTVPGRVQDHLVREALHGLARQRQRPAPICRRSAASTWRCGTCSPGSAACRWPICYVPGSPAPTSTPTPAGSDPPASRSTASSPSRPGTGR